MIPVTGTELYMYADSTLSKIACVSNISGLGEAMQMRGRATLCDDVNFDEPAFPEYGQVTFTARLSAPVANLLTVQRAKQEVKFFIGLGKGAQPFYEAGAVRTPGSRSWVNFDGQFTGFATTLTPQGIAETQMTINVTSELAVLPIGNGKTWSNGNKWSNGNYWR